MSIFTEKKSSNNHFCPLCKNLLPPSFLKRQQIPVHQNFLYDSYKKARNCIRGDIELAFCEYCGFISNLAFNPDLLEYSDNYDNTQTYSPFFYNYLNEISTYLTKKYDLIDKKIIEVGCGKGDFLKILCKNGNNKGVGFDPSYRGPKQYFDGSIQFIKDFFNSHKAAFCTNADFFCCRHVLEHLKDPLNLLTTIRKIINGEQKVQLFFETPDVMWILDNLTFWDIFYEHCSYFNLPSLKYLFSKAGFKINKITLAFEKQYFWIETQPSKNNSYDFELPPAEIESIAIKVQTFVKNYNKKLEDCRHIIREIREEGQCAIWGGAAKGVTLLNIIDPKAELIDAVIDINPNKQGKYIPGTGHPIIPPENIIEKKYSGIFNMNPNYLKENQEILNKLSVKIPLLSF